MAEIITIKLDRERSLRLDFNALSDADQVAGARINELLTGEHVSIAAMRALLWAGLKHDDPRLTVERTGELVQQYLASGNTLVDLRLIINRAFEACGLFSAGSAAPNGTAETQGS